MQQRRRCPAPRLIRPRAPIGQPELAAALDPTPDAGLPTVGWVRHLAVTHPWLAKSCTRPRVSLVFLIWFFFCPRLWDTPCDPLRTPGAAGLALPVPSLGHLFLGPARQEAAAYLVDINAAGATFAAMSGSGSAVFGLFERADAARRTANDLARPGWLSLHTRTLNRREYARRVAAGL